MNSIVSSLEKEGFAVVKDFLNPSETAAARAEIDLLREKAAFLRAGIGKEERHALRDDIRRDETRWWDFGNLTPAQSAIAAKIETLKTELNRELFLGLWEIEGHYAVYSPGAFYRRHVDRFSNDDRRKVSIVIFFNEGWDAGRDGGCLRLHPPGRASLEIAPESGTLACFLSDRIPHEVLETKRERLSFAGWWKTR